MHALSISICMHADHLRLMSRFQNPASPLSLYREASFGHGRLRIMDETRAHWSWHRNNDSNSFSADEVWLDSISTSTACWATDDEKEPPKFIANDEL